LIQRRQPSVVSSARAACSMRSRSALRRASRSASVSGLRLERRAVLGSFGLGARFAGRVDPPPPARPPGRASIGWRVGPPAGVAGLRGRVEIVVERVGDAVVGLELDRPALGLLLPAGRGLGRLVGGVGALDGLFEPSAYSCLCRRRHNHDLRHSFAVRTRLDAYRADGDPAPRIAALSTYLGHVDPGKTYWYLQAAPELMQLAGERLQRHLEAE
jgi:hypothetical protein